ncbi:MAG: hypothetical protein LQ349_009732, partial [Xanthoria aureola]
ASSASTPPSSRRSARQLFSATSADGDEDEDEENRQRGAPTQLPSAEGLERGRTVYGCGCGTPML